MQDSLEFGQTGMRQIKPDVKSATQQTDVYYVDCIKRKKKWNSFAFVSSKPD